MGYQIPGHGSCLVCHPDLDRKTAKGTTKGNWHIKPSIRRKLQGRNFDELADEHITSIDGDMRALRTR